MSTAKDLPPTIGTFTEPAMKAFGLRWWLAAGGLVLLFATLELSSIALNARVAAPRATQSHGAMTPPVAEGELLDAPEMEQVPPVGASVLTR